MSKIIFTDYNTVEHSYKDSYRRIRESVKIIKEYFNELDKELGNSEKNVFLEYDEKTNKFTLLSEEDTYELIPTKKQMEEFKNNENTLFNNRIRKCLKLSEEKRHYHKIKKSGVFDGVDDALFFIKYRDIRGLVNTDRTKGAREYIAENVTEDFDKYIEYFNNRIEKLNDNIQNIKNEEQKNNKINYYGISAMSILTIIITILSIIIGYHILVLYTLTLGGIAFLLNDLKYEITRLNEKIDPYNEEIKDIEEVIGKLKEKELQSKRTNNIEYTKENNKVDKKQFENKLAKSLYLIRLEAKGLSEEILEYVTEESLNITKNYKEEIESCKSNDVENSIIEKTLERVNLLNNYITLAIAAKYHNEELNNNSNEEEYEPDIAELIQQKPLDGLSMSLKQR